MSITANDWMMLFFIMMVAMLGMEIYSSLFSSRPRHMIERPVDVRGRIHKNLKKSGKANMGGTAIKWLDCIGEADYYDFTYGRIVGLHSGMYTEVVHVRTGRFSPVQRTYIPREIVRDKHGLHFCVECNGFILHGGVYVPVWTSTTTKEQADAMLQACLDQDAYMVKMEEIIELSEQEAHAMVDALSVKGRNSDIINRKDYLDKVPGREGMEVDDDD